MQPSLTGLSTMTRWMRMLWPNCRSKAIWASPRPDISPPANMNSIKEISVRRGLISRQRCARTLRTPQFSTTTPLCWCALEAPGRHCPTLSVLFAPRPIHPMRWIFSATRSLPPIAIVTQSVPGSALWKSGRMPWSSNISTRQSGRLRRKLIS